MQYFMIMQYGYLERVGRHVRHLGSLKLIFSQAVHLTDMFCIIVKNFVEIDHTVSGTSQFIAFFFWQNVKIQKMIALNMA